MQPDERLLRQIGRQCRVSREPVEIPRQPMEVGVEQLHDALVERRRLQCQNARLRIVSMGGAGEHDGL
jgi:hypothetical protein